MFTGFDQTPSDADPFLHDNIEMGVDSNLDCAIHEATRTLLNISVGLFYCVSVIYRNN